MPTPKDAPYKLRQREAHYATMFDAGKVRLTLRGGPVTVQTRGKRTYVVDPVTNQWWRPEKWMRRPAHRR